MEDELDNSVRLLKEACSPSGKLFRKAVGNEQKDRRVDLSLTIAAHELKRILNPDGTFFYEDSILPFMGIDKSVTVNTSQINRMPWKTTVEGLNTGFFEVLQSHSGGYDILDIVSDLSRCCTDAVKVIRVQKSQMAISYIEEEAWLKNEANTWRLIFILYQDRLLSQNLMEDQGFTEYFSQSETACVQNLFKRDSLIRESQLIVDWLEHNAADADSEILHFSDNTVGWENTLHQLQSAETIAFSSPRQIITQIDPDASHVQGKPLHDLDAEDEKTLSRRIFEEIRCGRLDEAQKLSKQYGHPWKAALFEGWRLFHNPNIPQNIDDAESLDAPNDKYEDIRNDEFKEIMGNFNRDIWKNIAIKYCKQDYLNDYEKAAVGAYCGYVPSVLPVCNSWEDNLWAYMKSMIDIRVESEIRDYCMRSKEYLPLPEEYWAQRTSLNEIFGTLEKSKDPIIQEETFKPAHIIQKFIILEDVPNLLNKIKEWIEEPSAPTYFLRFLGHLVLFFDQIGEKHDVESIEEVLETYIKRLMEMSDTRLIAYYVSKLSPINQVHLYSQYLEKITDNEERKDCLMYAEKSGLDVFSITKRVVENIRGLSYDVESHGNAGHLQQKVTNIDRYKIDALDWVLFYENQKLEALIQVNALVFTFLTMEKLDAAQLAFEKIPVDVVQKIVSEENVTTTINQKIKEYFSYKAYLDAKEAFNKWFKQNNSKPLPPDELPENVQFAEKVAHQHKMSQYKADLGRWKLTTSHLAKSAKTMLYNVLLFPNGWLVGIADEEYLRCTCLPEVVVLLYSILLESKEYEECIQLADIIASENHCIYKVYSKEKLQEILGKLCEVSIILLNLKKDPWGNDVPV